tara:strand:+ start:18371 stop:18856 length:486 start_codon:yes stop_codon:yes gene_type:complete
MILPVSCSINLDFEASKVWQIISEPGNLNKVHPFCRYNKVVNWDRDRREDILEYLNGVTLHRNFYEWNEGEGYKLNIGRENGRKSKVIWKITGDKKSKLNITVYPHVFSNRNKISYFIIHTFFINPGLKKYLKSVLRGYKWYLENNKPVSKNQFGKHKWFS